MITFLLFLPFSIFLSKISSNMLQEIPLNEATLSHKLDVDSVVIVAKSLTAFRVMPNISVKQPRHQMPTLNLKVSEQLVLRLPQRQDGRQHKFYEFKMAGQGHHAIRVMFQYKEQRNNDNDGREYVLPNVIGTFFEIVRDSIKTLDPNCDTRNHGDCKVFANNWATFAEAIDERLNRMNAIVDNICFYRGIHGILCPKNEFRKFLAEYITTPNSPSLIFIQVHLGLKVTPPPNEALFIKISKAKTLHRDTDVPLTRNAFCAYHPFYVSLQLGHYR